MLGYEAYRWRLASFDGKPVRASNGVECAVNTSLEEERRKMSGSDRPSMVVVCSGINVEAYANRSAFAWLRKKPQAVSTDSRTTEETSAQAM